MSVSNYACMYVSDDVYRKACGDVDVNVHVHVHVHGSAHLDLYSHVYRYALVNVHAYSYAYGYLNAYSYSYAYGYLNVYWCVEEYAYGRACVRTSARALAAAAACMPGRLRMHWARAGASCA